VNKIGLIAGNRKFPLLIAEAARRKGHSVIAVAIKGDTCALINKLADKVYWLKLSEFKRLFDIFKEEGVGKVIMAGQVSPARLFSKEVLKSKDLQEILSTIHNKKADSIFGVIADKLKENGLDLADSTTFVENLLPVKGVLTLRQPDQELWEDIHFGFELAKACGELDIGQTVAVKSKAIIAVEALEGTDNLILRAGRISRGGATIVKVAKPKQDMRFDIPVVGLKTIKSLIRAKAKCLAIEANKTLFIDKDISIRLAERKGIIVVCV
jgi:DUF1009 family protein